MGSTIDAERFARRVRLITLSLAFEVACGGCTDRAALPAKSDAGATPADASPSVDAGGDRATPDARCVSTFVASSSCIHPRVERDCRDGWCRIPRGCFVMGSPLCQFGRGLYNEDENEVTLTHDFEIQQHETTRTDWTSAGLPSPMKTESGRSDCSGDDCPVGNITWFDALAFANRLSALHVPPLPECYRLVDCTGAAGNGMVCATVEQTAASVYDCAGYRLPTEAEWEYAARAGTRTPFYGGDFNSASGDTLTCALEPALEPIAWYCTNASDVRVRPVGGRRPNEWGLHDTLGNVGEWVSDAYDSHGYGSAPRVDPGGTVGASGIGVVRGGNVISPASVCTASRRVAWFRATSKGATFGLRFARTLPLTDGGADAGL